jgi:hypothetical protein
MVTDIDFSPKVGSKIRLTHRLFEEALSGLICTANTLKEPVCDLLAGKFLLSQSSIASKMSVFQPFSRPPYL